MSDLMPDFGSDDAARMGFREIRAVMQKYGLGGTAFLVSKERTFFVRELPEWAALRLEGDAIRVRIKTAEVGKEKAEELANQTAAFICSMMDMTANEFAIYDQILKMLSDHWDIDHKGPSNFNPEADQ